MSHHGMSKARPSTAQRVVAQRTKAVDEDARRVIVFGELALLAIDKKVVQITVTAAKLDH